MNNSFYPNQRQIVINREVVQKGIAGNRVFLVAYQDNIINAMTTLSHTAFKVYLCLLFNKDQYSVEYSPEHISHIAGMTATTARKAFKELEENNFLIRVDDKHFLFYEYPKKSLSLKPSEEKREFIDDESGEVYHLTYKELVEIMGNADCLSMWKGAKVYEPKSSLE